MVNSINEAFSDTVKAEILLVKATSDSALS